MLETSSVILYSNLQILYKDLYKDLSLVLISLKNHQV